MTKQQEKMVVALKKDIIRYDFHDSDKKGFTLEDSKYEFKTFEVKDDDGVVSVYSVVGLKGDEGTMAACFARTTRQIFIGKRGGVRTYINTKKNGKAVLTNYSDVIIYGRMS